MLDPFEEMILYLRVAQAFRAKLQMSDRDRALLLAGTCAHVLQQPAIAEFCRRLVLKNNQGHMLRNYSSFAEALQDPDFGFFIKQVRRKLSPEHAEAQLVTLGDDCDVRRSDYESDAAYAAAVMGVDIEWLNEHFG